MVFKWSKLWKRSKKPSKQRLYRINAPLHIRQKLIKAPLSKELKKKQGVKSLGLRKGDQVKIMRGQFKGKIGKVIKVDLKKLKVFVENIEIKSKSGNKKSYPLDASNVMITELNLEDKNRLKRTKKEEKRSKEK